MSTHHMSHAGEKESFPCAYMLLHTADSKLKIPLNGILSVQRISTGILLSLPRDLTFVKD